jgi:Tfp pilus assembly protein PilX
MVTVTVMVMMMVAVLIGAVGMRTAMVMAKLSYNGSEQTVAILDSERVAG